MTPFSFEHAFTAGCVADVLAGYFDDELQAEHDRVLGIARREVLERTAMSRVCRVTPHRQLPALVRSFVTGPLQYVESVTRHGDEVAIDIRPSVGRTQISATYRVDEVGPRTIRRRYTGAVSVDIALVGRRIECGIVEELAAGLARTAPLTQGWLDRIPRSMAARA